MSRWTKRQQQTVVPLDNLLREKENKNSVAVGTVMKFGVMQFTSIRSSCYNMGALSSTSPVQNSANDLNDMKISTEITPKPRKFFKSRNAAPPGEIQQQIALQQQMAMQMHLPHQTSNHHSFQHSPEDQQHYRVSPQKQTRKKHTVTPKKEKVIKPKVEKPPKIKKEKPMKEPKIKEIAAREEPFDSDDEVLSPRGRGKGAQSAEGTRSSGRARGKLVNYNEERDEEEFFSRTEKRIVPKHLKSQQQAQLVSQTTPSHTITTSSIESQNLHSQNSMESSASSNQAINHPPIVLRISKGTSRLVSTDNEDGVVKSPVRGNSSSDENKNVTNTSGLASTDELIAVLSGENDDAAAIVHDEEKPPEQKAERIRIRIKKDYIRSYNDSLKEQEEERAKKEVLEQEKNAKKAQPEPSEVNEPLPVRATRRRGKQQENTPRISPIVSEFDSQSSLLGSMGSNNTTASSTVMPQSDCKVIHSRGSSVVTSDIDTSQPSSLAAAPPSEIQNPTTGSENNSMEVEEVAPPVVQKGRGRRKKVIPEVHKTELKPPEPVAVVAPPKATTNNRGRNTRGNKSQAPPPADTSNETASSNVESIREKSTARSTRSTRSNQTQSTIEIDRVPVVPVPVPTPRFFPNRKRKNVASLDTSFASNSNSDQTSALNLSQKTDLSSAPSTVSTNSSSVPEYKHKKLVKRSWEQDSHSMEIDPPSPPAAATTTTARTPSKQSNNNHVQKQTEQAENPGVKLLISKKKGSIFKSRALEKDESDNKKRNLNLYKHKWDEDAELMDCEEGNNKPENLTTSNSGNADASFFEGEPSGLTRFTRTKKSENATKDSSMMDDFEEDDDQPVTGLKCDKNAKNYYQVVRNVKKAHQIQEIGEFQEMDDDVEYLLDALQPNKQVALRCLSALQLASKCMTPSFRMHIRAHGIVPKFFKALEDAPNDPSLGLCTAMVMFALSQDTLKMDLDRGSLELMLNLLECEGKMLYPKDVVMNKQHMERKQKVRELCEEIQGQGKSIHLNLDNITAAQLAMESLLSLTSKRAGEWLKEDLRELGGIEHIIRTVNDCCNQITEFVEEWTEPLLEKLNKIGRCLRILENVTSMNEENQRYIIHYKSQVFVKTLCKFFNLISTELAHNPTTEKSGKETPAVAIRETLVPLLKVIINLTHPFNDRAIGSVFFGDYKEIFQICINLLLFGVNSVSSRLQFDFSLLTLVLLSNLTQLNEKNRQSIMHLQIPVEEFGKEKQPALKSLIDYFYKCEDKAKTLKKLTDDLIDSSKQRDAKQDEAVSALIQNSGTHMENTILGSFTSTLIGFVIMFNPNNENIARKYLRTGKFKDMVAVLMQYYEFLNLTVSADASSMAQLKTIKNVMDFLRNADNE